MLAALDRTLLRFLRTRGHSPQLERAALLYARAGENGLLWHALAAALADGGLDQPARRSWADGRAPSLRWILVHLIEEYARHNGHADLLREAIDGATGE